MIEEFFKNYQYTILALGVLATFLVSVVAVRQSQTKANAKLIRIPVSFIDSDPFVTYLYIEIQNRGLLPIYIDRYFSIQCPFKPIQTLSFGNFATSPEDFTILPKSRQRFYISDDDLAALNFDHNALKLIVIKGTIATQDGKRIRVKNMKSELNAHLKEL